MLKIILIALSGLVVAVAISASFVCPCERIPGGYLLGAVDQSAIEDWSFANDVGLCELEVSGVLPHSVTLNCMADQGELFISCSRCDGKYWSGVALANPDGRIRIGDMIYPVALRKLDDAETLDRAWIARVTKLNQQGERPDHWWSFELTSR